jgi:hypothetical protein
VKRWHVSAVALAVLLVGCGDGAVDLPQPAEISIDQATDGQSGLAGTRLPKPLAVVVTAADGRPVTRAEVRWTVVDETGGSVLDALTISDGGGRAEVGVTLGAVPGNYSVRATLDAVPTKVVTFSFQVLPAPTLTSVSPATFTGGDEVALDGTLLSTFLHVEIGGSQATVLSASITGTRISVRVPPCLVPGTVEIKLIFPYGESAPITGTYQELTGSLALDPGDHVLLDPSVVAGCASFPAAGSSGAQYLVVPQATAGIPGVSVDYRLGGNPVMPASPATAPPAFEPTAAERFHDFLRRREEEFARIPKPLVQAPALAEAAAGAIQPGDERDFSVCAVVTCNQPEDFEKVTAVARYVGEHAALYMDRASPDTMTTADLESIGRLFDEEIYDVVSRAFGAESDIDANGHVLILMTPVVNGLTPSSDCETSIVTGFFFAIDIDPAFKNDSRSNQGEVFYALTPDPGGTAGGAQPVDRVRRLVPVTFSHELQHMISYNQHVLLRGGGSEVLWMNEAMSHLSEELAALHFEATGNQDLFSQFAIGNLYNGYLYLSSPVKYWVLFQEGTGTLAERGGAWLLLRWLADQFGPDIVRRLAETDSTGAANIAAATGEPFGRLVSEWILANWVSDNPAISLSPSDDAKLARLRYKTWNFRQTYESLHDQLPNRFPRVFPLIPQSFPGGTFAVADTLKAGSGEYVLITQGPGDLGFALQFLRWDSSPLTGLARPRLNVLRLR